MSGKKRSGCGSLILLVAMLSGAIWLAEQWATYRDAQAREDQAKAHRELVQKKYDANRDQILIDLRRLADAKEWGRAKRYLDEFSIISDDPSLNSLRDRITAGWSAEEEKRLLTQVRKLPASKIEENLMLYKQLRKLNPGKALYKQKIQHYQGVLNERRALEQAEKERREKKFGKQPEFPKWSVSQYLESIAHDPDSIDVQACTPVRLDEKKGWIVGCTFRGKNAFGAMIRKSAWFHLRGNVVIEQMPENAYKYP